MENKKDNELRTYEDIISFVNTFPGSSIPMGMMPNKLGAYADSGQVIKRDFAVERALNAEDALLIFDKYRIVVHDRKRLIEAILNMGEPI